MNVFRNWGNAIQKAEGWDKATYIPLASNVKGVADIAMGAVKAVKGLGGGLFFSALKKIGFKGYKFYAEQNLKEASQGMQQIVRGAFEQLPLIGNAGLASHDIKELSKPKFHSLTEDGSWYLYDDDDLV